MASTLASTSASAEPESLERQGYEKLQSGLLDRARAAFSELIARYPEDHRGYQGAAWVAETGWQWRTALGYWEQCLALASADRNAAAFRKAHCLNQIGEVDAARQLFSELPGHLQAALALARLATAQDGPVAAAAEWEKCIQNFSDNAEAHLGKAEYLMARDAYADAETILGKIIGKWPQSTTARVRWAHCAAVGKDWQTAEERWEPLLDKFSGDAGVRKAFMRYLAVRGDFARVTFWMAKLAEQPVAFAECLVEYHLARDDYGAAAEQARKLVELEPRRPDRRFALADILVRLGSGAALQAALAIFRNLHRQAPDSVWVRIRLAETLVRSRSPDEAVELIETMAAGDRRSEIQVLRAWQEHLTDEAKAALRWKTVLQQTYMPAVHARIDVLNRIDSNNLAAKPGDLLVFAAVKNEKARLDWFLNYYRRLGADKFIIVDNDSTDGTAEQLRGEPDVILYHTPDRYSLAGWGVRWINEVIDRHGRENWCLYLDADEAFVFPDSETTSLKTLTHYLDTHGFEAVVAPMLDMYPAEMPSKEGSLDELQSLYGYFDWPLYSQAGAVCPYLEFFGGIRRRLFAGFQLLTKVPLINGAAGIKFLMSTHRITPAKVADITGALLHYHLIGILQPEYQPLLNEAIANREFPSSSLERLRSRELLRKLEPLKSLRSKDAVHFESTAQLTGLGVLHPGRSRFIH
jgi:tetratricopeptide (TPR) repeat protein